MVETAEDERWAHIRGITVTSVASLFGIAAGIAASYIAEGPDDTIGVILFAVAVFIQFPFLRIFRIQVEDFGVKDYLFITFMTFCFWFVTWAIMMTTGAELPL